MTSWPDSAALQVRTDLEDLLRAATGFATNKLAKHGDFPPFAAGIKRDGGIKLVGTQSVIPEDEVPKNLDLEALCWSAMMHKRDYLCAAAVVTHPAGRHEIQIALEHNDGVALTVMLPFKRTRFTHTVSLGDPVMTSRPAQIWA